MDRASKLAVLVPVFNGGANLRRSIESCRNGGLHCDEYEILVVDNCSTDNAVNELAEADRAGAPLHIFRNETNIGRVENWNRAVELAVELGFQHISFLFAGDTWKSGTGLRELLALVQESGARAGFSPFVVTDGDGAVKYESRRFYVSGNSSVVCTSAEFVATMLESGMFPLGPIQANIYRVDGSAPLWFDPEIPRRADVQATLEFVQRSNGPVVITSTPFLQWREHAGRFHASMGPARTIEDYMDTFLTACTQTEIPVNHARAQARVVLNSLRLMVREAPVTQWPGLLLVIGRTSRRTPYPLKPVHFLETLWSRFALGRRLLQFG